jgi:uncharacterized repeat protein (TIGR03803 family)
LRAVSVALALLAVVAVAVVATPSAQAETYKLLYTFSCGHDGAYPEAGLLRGPAGQLYGTTALGGIAGQGTVFEVLPFTGNQNEIMLCSFFGVSVPDGSYPIAGLVRDAEDSLYGTTVEGGPNNAGTVFKLSLGANTDTILHSFTYGTAGGAYPYAALAIDSKGNLYGTTVVGGKLTCGPPDGCGTIFKVTPSGVQTVLHSFQGTDGAYPYAGVILDSAGNLYGTTAEGGANGGGTVFKLTPKGTLTVLHSFDFTDGAYPLGGLVMDAAGNLYGTTSEYGAGGAGTVFKLTSAGVETVLHNFETTDGANPQTGLVADTGGYLYGTTAYGGTNGFGTVFKVAPGPSEGGSVPFTSLHNFAVPDGTYPLGLIIDPAGNLYGTTSSGGANGCGTVFILIP